MFQILLVEDDQQFRRALKQELSEWFPSIDIEEASDGKEAMEKVELSCPKLVFMDIRLPDDSGIETTKKIKAKFPDANVTLLTSYDLPEYRQAAAECGANHFFVKGTSDGREIKLLVKSLLEK